MARRLRMNELVGDLTSEQAHQVGMALKKTDVLVIRDRDQSIDLDGKVTPILEEQFDRRSWQSAFEKFAHERAPAHTFLPTLDNLPVQLIDISFRVSGAHFDAELGCDWDHSLG